MLWRPVSTSIVAVVASTALLQGCTSKMSNSEMVNQPQHREPVIDASTKDAFEASVSAIMDSLPKEKRVAFYHAHVDVLQAAGSDAESQQRARQQLHGMNADQVIAEGQKFKRPLITEGTRGGVKFKLYGGPEPAKNPPEKPRGEPDDR